MIARTLLYKLGTLYYRLRGNYYRARLRRARGF